MYYKDARLLHFKYKHSVGNNHQSMLQLVILYWLKIEERKTIVKSHENLSLLLPALHQFFTKVCSIISSDA